LGFSRFNRTSIRCLTQDETVLLFVFWYCHKRGKETRLARESAAKTPVSESDIEVSDPEESVILEKPSDKAEGSPSGAEHQTDENRPDDLAPKADTRATAADLPSVLDLPEPQAVPLSAHEEKAPVQL
jgi:hypothetical protein